MKESATDAFSCSIYEHQFMAYFIVNKLSRSDNSKYNLSVIFDIEVERPNFSLGFLTIYATEIIITL